MECANESEQAAIVMCMQFSAYVRENYQEFCEYRKYTSLRDNWQEWIRNDIEASIFILESTEKKGDK